MFQFSVTLAEVVFYLWQVSSHACYFQARGSAIYVVLIVVACACILLGVVTVPLYSLATTTTHHDHDIKNPHAKSIKKTLKTHKAVLNADMTRLKVSLGLEEEAEPDTAGLAGWKGKVREKKKQEGITVRDPVKQAEIDAKKNIRGTFEWAIHMSQLEARIKLAKEELQAAQRVKALTKAEQKNAVEAAKKTAEAKVKANQVAPSPESPSEQSGETTPLNLAGEPPSPEPHGGSAHDVERGGEHAEGGHGETGANIRLCPVKYTY